MNYLDMIDPADSMSVLVAADWLEESGHTTEADALRTLDLPLEICNYVCGHGYGFGDGHGNGDGDSYGYGSGDSYGSGFSDGHGNGDGYNYGYGSGDSYGYGEGHGYGYDYAYDVSTSYTKIENYLSCMRIFLKSGLSSHPRGIYELR